MGSTERKPIPKVYLTDQIRPTVVNARLNFTTLDKLINRNVQGCTGQVVEKYFFFVCYLKLYLMFVTNHSVPMLERIFWCTTFWWSM
jgi:hypothetical protein